MTMRLAVAAKKGVSGFSAQTKRDLSEYLNEMRAAIDRTITPVLRRVEYLTEAQFKRRAWLLGNRSVVFS